MYLEKFRKRAWLWTIDNVYIIYATCWKRIKPIPFDCCCPLVNVMDALCCNKQICEHHPGITTGKNKKNKLIFSIHLSVSYFWLLFWCFVLFDEDSRAVMYCNVKLRKLILCLHMTKRIGYIRIIPVYFFSCLTVQCEITL